MKLKDIGEFGFIERIAHRTRAVSPSVVKGIGDDCAVIESPGPDLLLVTTDLLVERVHFLLDWYDPKTLGAKALAVNISDIAACGGIPLDAFVSLAIPDHVDVEFLDALYAGMSETAERYGVHILGGDTTGSKTDLIINVALTGRVPRDEVLLRHTARPGDTIVLTGPVGASAAGCRALLGALDVPPAVRDKLIHVHLNPVPHVPEGRFLAQSGVCSACIDVSDGLSSDLAHVCTDSCLGATISETLLPVHPALADLGHLLPACDILELALHSGEEYVLLAAVRSDSLEHLLAAADAEGLTLYPVGTFDAEPGLRLRRNDGTLIALKPRGWDHFKPS
jgi:thiamine-monophosphate kinase